MEVLSFQLRFLMRLVELQNMEQLIAHLILVFFIFCDALLLNAKLDMGAQLPNHGRVVCE